MEFKRGIVVKSMQQKKVMEAIQSPQYEKVRRRVFRQLIESLIYEKLISPAVIQDGEGCIFYIEGHTCFGEMVTYKCRGRKRMTFGRIRLYDEPVIRTEKNKSEEATSIAQFLRDVFGTTQVDEQKLQSFTRELEQTIFKDTIAQHEREKQREILLGKAYDELESSLIDGHPYHPSYKARIGFTYADNFEYGFEFKKTMKLVWIAVHHKYTDIAASHDEDFEQVLQQELGQEKLEEFRSVLCNIGCKLEDYTFMPVHPWQWENYIVSNYVEHLYHKYIIFVGESEDEYRPQQSMRTLYNDSNQHKPYIKLSMNLLNTSTLRTLKPHSIVSAPVISNWLQKIVESDSYFKEETRLILLKEFAGVTYDPPSSSTYGSLGCVFRESIHPYLQGKEEAMPFNALYGKELGGALIINPWLEKNGIENWLRELIKKAVMPVVHLLVEHGIALESHGQNMVLIHEKGRPVGVALKDFHEGVEFYREFLKDPGSCPDFTKIHKVYKNWKLNDFFEMDRLACMREMLLDALFLFNFGELAMMLEDEYGYNEEQFWTLVVEQLEAHVARRPHLQERLNQLDLFVPTFHAEQLTKRRLYVDDEALVHEVPNPLYAVKELVQS